MGKIVKFGAEARQQMQVGLDILANAVKQTLGPRGRHVAIEVAAYGPPSITKDGVTVARSISLDDRLQNMGAQLVKAVASATNTAAGDGTTTATVLAQAIYTQGSKMVAAGHNPVLIKRGIDIAVKAVVAKLKEISVPVEDTTMIQHVATISANNDHDLGKTIADAISAVGEHGMVSVEEATGAETRVTFTEGLKIDRGYMSVGFITNMRKGLAEFENPFILAYDGKLTDPKRLVPLLEGINRAGRPIVLFVRDIDEPTLSFFIQNKINGALPSVVVKAPGFGDYRTAYLSDIATLTGGFFYSEKDSIGIDGLSIDGLGTSKKVVVGQNTTYIVDGAGNVASLIEELKAQLADSELHEHQEDLLKDRIAKLSGAVAVLHVGGTSESEMRERKDRVEDSINAVRAAIEEGIVPGGGSALLYCSIALNNLETSFPEEQIGIDIIKSSLSEPFQQIMKNAGESHYAPMQSILQGDGKYGYDALRGKEVPNMLEAGIIDPVKVVRAALENAASASGILLTTEVAIYQSDLEYEKD